MFLNLNCLCSACFLSCLCTLTQSLTRSPLIFSYVHSMNSNNESKNSHCKTCHFQKCFFIAKFCSSQQFLRTAWLLLLVYKFDVLKSRDIICICLMNFSRTQVFLIRVVVPQRVVLYLNQGCQVSQVLQRQRTKIKRELI